MHYLSRNHVSGFTLIELMTVIVIIGIIAMVAFPSYRQYVNNAKIAQATVTIDAIDTSQRTYFADNNSFYYAQFAVGQDETKIVDGGTVLASFDSGTFDPKLFPAEGVNLNFFFITIFGKFDGTGTLIAGMDPNSTDTFKGGSGIKCNFPPSLARMDPVEVGVEGAPTGAYDYFLTQAVGNFSNSPAGNCVFLLNFGEFTHDGLSSSPIVTIN